jgi:SAM-dependent methyltransferase
VKVASLDEVLPLGQFLDVRSDGPELEQAVRIPLSELPDRMYELPPRHATLLIADTGAEAQVASELLTQRGRAVQLVQPPPVAQTSRRWRLWKPNDFLLESVATREPGQALDLGCGAGREAVALAALGWRVTAIDRLPEALEMGRALARGYLNSHSAINWRQPPVGPSEAFDLAIALFLHDETAIQDAARVLKQQGILIVEGYTEAHRERHGQPQTPLDLERLRARLPCLNILHSRADWRGDRHTLRLLAQRKSGAGSVEPAL